MTQKDKVQFETYYQDYKDKVFSYLMYRLNFDRNLCEELLMDIVTKAYERFDQFDEDKGSFKTWFFTIAHNHLLNYWRDKKKVQSLDALEEKGVNLGSVEMEDKASKSFNQKNVEAILNLLTEKEREVISLRYLSDLSHKEIGEIMNKKEATVRTALSRAMKQFKQFHQKLYPQNNLQEQDMENHVAELFSLVKKQFSCDQAVQVDSQDHLVAQYEFQAKKQGVTIKKLTVLNDLEGHFDRGEYSEAIEAVQLRYKNKMGEIMMTDPLPLGEEGVIEFHQLEIHVPANQSTVVDILADMKNYDEFELTAKKRTYRLGFKSSPSQTEGLEAESEMGKEMRRAVADSRDLPGTQVVVGGLPKFKLNPLSPELKPGKQSIYSFSVTAPKHTSISLARLPLDFDIITTTHGQITLSDFSLYANEKNMDQKVEFTSYEEKTGNLKTKENLYENQDHYLTISFMEEEVIPAGQSRTYTLEANVTMEDPEEEGKINIELNFDRNSQCFADQVAFGSLIGDLFANMDEYQTFKEKGEDPAIAWSDQVREHYKEGHKFSLKSFKSSDDWIVGFSLESENGSMEQELNRY